MFRTQAVRTFLITYLSILLIWNIFVAIAFGELWSVVPLGLQFFIIALIVIEHSWTATFLRTWVIVFVIVAQGLKIGAKILASLNGELEYVTSPMFYVGVFQFLMGFVILYLARVFIREG